MSTLSNIKNISFQDINALCKFSITLQESIKEAIKKTRHEFESERSVLEFWDKPTDNSIVYGSFFPKNAGDTEIKYWTGLHWRNNNNKEEEKTSNKFKIVFYIYIPVNMTFVRPSIEAKLNSKGNFYEPYHFFNKHSVALQDQYMMKILASNATDNDLKDMLVNFIKEVLEILENIF